MPLKISSITPRGGRPLSLGQFSILVGPNNCGKSQTLLDIRDFITSGITSRLTILTEVGLELPSESEAMGDLRQSPHQLPGHTSLSGVSSDLQKGHEFAPPDGWLKQMYSGSSQPAIRQQLLTNMGTFWVAHLDAEGRFKLTAPTDSYDKRTGSPANALQAFFAGGKTKQEELRVAFREAFGIDIALDWAAMRRLYLRVGSEFGEIPEQRDLLDALLRDAPELSRQGDGYRSFAGVALAIMTFPTRPLLLDEPEAFLHPAQARVLGRWLATEARKRPAQVVVASHSADFLWGIISANVGATIIRLNRDRDTTKYHVIPSAVTDGLVRSPLLSSQPVLDSLFHRGVVVCEGDPDRAIYQTVAHTLLREIGGENVLFIHSNGKDAVKTPVELLRQAGTPVCAVVDFDVLNSEKILSEIMEALTGAPPTAKILEHRTNIAAQVELVSEAELLKLLQSAVSGWQTNEHTDVREARRALRSIAGQGSKWDAVKRTGEDFFSDEVRTEVQNLIVILRALGLFIVPKGQLESWINLKIAKGPKWNRAALERVHSGSCPDPLREFVRSIIIHLIPSTQTTA